MLSRVSKKSIKFLNSVISAIFSKTKFRFIQRISIFNILYCLLCISAEFDGGYDCARLFGRKTVKKTAFIVTDDIYMIKIHQTEEVKSIFHSLYPIE